MLASGWKSSASAYTQCSRPASIAPTVVFPLPETPITTMIDLSTGTNLPRPHAGGSGRHRGGRGRGQGHGDLQPAAVESVGRDRAAVRVADRADDRQTKTRTAGTGTLPPPPPERLQQSRKVGRRHPEPGGAPHEPGPRPGGRGPEP